MTFMDAPRGPGARAHAQWRVGARCVRRGLAPGRRVGWAGWAKESRFGTPHTCAFRGACLCLHELRTRCA